MSDVRDHLPAPPLGYHWRTEINMETRYFSAGLHPNSWAHLNPGKSTGFGSRFPAHFTEEDAYADLVQFAWIGVDMDAEIASRRSRR